MYIANYSFLICKYDRQSQQFYANKYCKIVPSSINTDWGWISLSQEDIFPLDCVCTQMFLVCFFFSNKNAFRLNILLKKICIGSAWKQATTCDWFYLCVVDCDILQWINIVWIWTRFLKICPITSIHCWVGFLFFFWWILIPENDISKIPIVKCSSICKLWQDCSWGGYSLAIFMVMVKFLFSWNR